MFKRILIPLDGSRFASKSLSYGEEIARRFDAELILLQVIKPAVPVSAADEPQSGIQSPATARISIQIALDEDKRNISKARRYLSRKVREIKSRNIKCSYVVALSRPADAIIRHSRTKKIDLIVMTSHGKSGIVRAVMGSVADEVVRNSGKPVLVIRPDKRSGK